MCFILSLKPFDLCLNYGKCLVWEHYYYLQSKYVHFDDASLSLMECLLFFILCTDSRCQDRRRLYRCSFGWWRSCGIGQHTGTWGENSTRSRCFGTFLSSKKARRSNGMLSSSSFWWCSNFLTLSCRIWVCT